MKNLFLSLNIFIILCSLLSSCAKISQIKQTAYPSITCQYEKEQSAEIAIKNVNLVPMTGEIVIKNQTVVVKGSKIIEIGPADEISIPISARIIEGKDAYLMPGLADMHVHLADNWPVHHLNLYLANGVTTIRSLSAHIKPKENRAYELIWRDKINNGTCTGPRIYSSGPIIDGVIIDKWRMDFAKKLNSSSFNKETQKSIINDVLKSSGFIWCFSPKEARQAVFEQKEAGYDFIKPYGFLSKNDFIELMKATKETNMYTVGHIPYVLGIDDLIHAKMNEIAHIQEILYLSFKDVPGRCNNLSFGPPFLECFYNSEIDLKVIEDTINKLRGAGVYISTTLVIDEVLEQITNTPSTFLNRPEVKFLPKALRDNISLGKEGPFKILIEHKDIFAKWKELTKNIFIELKKVGIPMILGTDAGTGGIGIVPGFSLHDELRIVTDHGFTPYEAIAAATKNAARVAKAMGKLDDWGTIEIGKRADFILVNNNPLEDVAHIKDNLGVMAAGIWYSRETLDKMIALKK
ncbi:amidohydrolase family protein [bacterium]|nr:amidohydrolase family protein [bacterium]